MTLANQALAAFQTAAGIPADKLSLFVRTILMVLSFTWAAWCVYGEIHHFRHNGMEIDLSFSRVMRVLLLLALIVVLVFIGSGG